MANNIWTLHREITQNNGRTRPSECENQIIDDSHFKILQNPFTNLNNHNHGNSSSIGVGSKGYAIGYQNSSRPILHKQNNFRYSPYGGASNHINHIPHSRINLNSYQGSKDFAIPKAILPPIRPIETKDLDLFFSYRNGNASLTMEHCVFDIRKKELLLFNNDKITNAVIENGDANENDDEHLDLSLHL